MPITHEQRLAVPVVWKENDTVMVAGKKGTVRYVYTNGFTLIQFEDRQIKGGVFNNNSTFSNEEINPL